MYKYTIDKTANLICVEFEGDISIEEYRQLLIELVESPDFQKSPMILIDQRRGRLGISMEDARAHPMFVQGLEERLGEPKVAVVTSSDFDFGMNRLFELSSEAMLSCTGKVFRDMHEAREWLGISHKEE
jgi:hypothetical protein